MNGRACVLDPERCARELAARGLGPLVYRDRVDSTNTLALRLAREGAAAGTVVVAAEQTAGRGRAGARWESRRGLGLYLSWLARPAIHLEVTPYYGLLGGVAAVAAVRKTTGLKAGLKWPNDVLVGGRKAGGVLAEAELPAVVVGVGLNLFHRRDQLPPRPLHPATSLRLEGWEGEDGTNLAVALVRELTGLYGELEAQGPAALEAPLRAAWLEYGRWVETEGGPASGCRGRIVGLNLRAGHIRLVDREGCDTAIPVTSFVRLRPLAGWEGGGAHRAT